MSRPLTTVGSELRERTGSLLTHTGAALRRVPRAAWICALVAFLNAACWSLITPPFQVTVSRSTSPTCSS